MKKTEPTSILNAVKETTGWSDAKIAGVIGISKAAVFQYRTGAQMENLDDVRFFTLRETLTAFHSDIGALLAELEELA